MGNNSQKTLRCFIIDDEVSSQAVLQHFIAETKTLQLIGTYNNTAAAFEALKINVPDLMFLDINMPRETGLDFYKRLIQPPQVIFTTAYPQYAVEGFEVNATDYLLKPIAYHRFLTAIERVFDKAAGVQGDFIMINENKTLHKVFFEDIMYAEAFGDYVKVFTKEKLIITHSTFSRFIEELPEYFIRVHKSFTINLNEMDYISGNIVGVGQHKIPIGQTYKASVMEHLKT